MVKKTACMFGMSLLLACVVSVDRSETLVTYRFVESEYRRELLLRSDSTFLFGEMGHMVSRQSSGIWRTRHDTIVLTSFKQHGLKSITESADTLADSVIVEVFTDDTIPLAGAAVVVNGYKATQENMDNARIIDSRGRSSFRMQKVSIITISLLDEYSFCPTVPENNHFVVYLTLKEDGYRYFMSERAISKKDTLTMSNGQILFLIH